MRRPTIRSASALRDVENLKTRNDYGDMVPIGSVATFRDTTGPFRVPRYNLYPAAEVQLSLARGFSTGQAIAAIETDRATNACRRGSASNGPRSRCRKSSPATPP